MSDEARQPKTRYTEAETLAILDAERLGKPFPTFEPKSDPISKAQADVVSHQRALEALEAEREKNKVYQLAFWPDDKRAMPGDFIACALFSCLQGKDSEYVERRCVSRRRLNRAAGPRCRGPPSRGAL
jgi:hypothetical protein